MVKHEKAAVLPGISASPGIVIGKAYVRREDSKSFVPRTLISPSQIHSELQRLRRAQDMVAEELENLREKIIRHLGSSYSDIISAQLAVLNDDEVRKEVESYMKEHHVNVAFAYRFVISQYIEFLEEHESEYFRERVADIRDIKQRVLRALISKHTVHSSLKMDDPTIFVARELNPTDIVMLVSENVVGFVTEFGGKTSHAAIMARAMKVPMLIGIKDAGYRIETGQPLVLDADHRKLIVQPGEEVLNEIKQEIQALQRQDRIFQEAHEENAVTEDGYRLTLSGNISLPLEVKDVIKYGGEGIGLYRTEYLYLMKQHLPGEEELFREYRHVVESMNGQQVIIRTIDLGGDKMSVLWDQDIRCEANPFMGYRAIRICLNNPPVFITQLRAILRSSAFGKVSIMLPMITHIEQLTESLEHIEDVKAALREEHIPFDESIRTGMMVETPSAVMNIEAFAEKVDYFSIGTNDLTQYTLAVDRGNERVLNVYDHYDPAVLKMIKMIVDAGRKFRIPVFVCGEMASEIPALFLFLAMKIDGVSVSPRYIGSVRRFIKASRQKEAEKHLGKILSMRTRREISTYLNTLIDKSPGS